MSENDSGTPDRYILLQRSVGAAVGTGVGALVGPGLGKFVGMWEGGAVGVFEGKFVGSGVVGLAVWMFVG